MIKMLVNSKKFLIIILLINTVISASYAKEIQHLGRIIYFPSKLEVQGSKIIDVYNGCEIVLRGFILNDNDYIYGFGDREPYAPQWVQDSYMPLTQEHMNQIKRWGFDVIYLINFWTSPQLEPHENLPGVYNKWWMNNILIKLIRMAEVAGLYVVLGIRVCFDPKYTVSGDYPWFGWSTHDYVVFNQLDASGSRGLERYCKFLEWFTNKVQGEPNVVGISPWHFPYHRQPPDQERIDRYFNNVVPAMIKAIRKYTNKLIFLSPPRLGRFDYNLHPGPFNDTNVIYCTGGYGDLMIVSDPDWNPWDYRVDKINHPHPSWKSFRDKYNVPVMSVEGPGISQHSFDRPIPQDRLDLFEAVLKICDEMNGWIIFYYSGPGANWGILEKENPNDPASEGAMVKILLNHTPPPI